MLDMRISLKKIKMKISKQSAEKSFAVMNVNNSLSQSTFMGLCQPVLMKLYLESNSFTNWVLFFDFDFEFNLNSINKVLP
ncbi:hypothetical protein ACA584_13375, partial [Lactiplantibacillus plantarum]